MLADYTIPKPATLGTYECHRLVAGLTGGKHPLFVDMGDRVIVRADKPIADLGQPLPTVKTGEVRAFELRASCGVRNKGRHRYFPHGDWRARHEWLRRRAGRHGFNVLNLHVVSTSDRVAKNGRVFRVDRSDFMGILKVTDAAAFHNMLSEGMPGPGRAFGYGMMIIYPKGVTR